MGLVQVMNKGGKVLGLGGGQGEYYQPGQFKSGANDKLNEIISMSNNSKFQDLQKGLGNNSMSLADVLSGAGQAGNQDTALAALASSPVAGSSLASLQARNDPSLKGLIGEGGSLERSLSEEKRLQDRGYSLQPEDHEAYGQAQDNIARMFGAQENSLSQALSNRGLGSAKSGVAQQQFSGLYGNKNEQLKNSMRQIADDRMNDTRQRIAENHAYNNQLGQLGLNAQGQMYGQNQTRNSDLQQKAQFDLSQYGLQEQLAQSSLQSKEQNEKIGFGDAWGRGTLAGTEAATKNQTAFWGSMGSGTSMLGGGGGGDSASGLMGGGGGQGNAVTEAGGSGASMKRKGVF